MQLRVQCRTVLADAREGASIAVNGVCLTAVQLDSAGFCCDLSPETLARTNLGALREGSPVNLERAAALGRPPERTHRAGPRGWNRRVPVAGHRSPDGNWWLKVRIPAELTAT